MESEYLLINSNKDKKADNWDYANLNNVIEAETKTTIECGSVTGIITLLDTESITL